MAKRFFLTLLLTILALAGATAPADAWHRRPVANFTWSPQPVVVNQTTSFSSAGSYCPHAPCVYRWDHAGSIFATGPSATYTYTTVTRKTVRLTITDARGRSASVTKSFDAIAATPPPPPPPPPPPSTATWTSDFEELNMWEWTVCQCQGTTYATGPEQGAAPHSGAGMAHFEVTEPQRLAGSVHAKVYKVWALREPETTWLDDTPSHQPYERISEGQEAGSYSAWYYFPANYQASSSSWTNIFQWKHSHRPANDPSTGGPNWHQEPQWWINVSEAQGWACCEPAGVMPAGYTGKMPVMFANAWRRGGGWYTPNHGGGSFRGVPLGRWFNIRADVYPGSRIEWFVDGQFWQSTPHSWFYVGLGYGHDPANIATGGPYPGHVDSSWIWGVGHYDGVGKLWADDAVFTRR